MRDLDPHLNKLDIAQPEAKSLCLYMAVFVLGS